MPDDNYFKIQGVTSKDCYGNTQDLSDKEQFIKKAINFHDYSRCPNYKFTEEVLCENTDLFIMGMFETKNKGNKVNSNMNLKFKDNYIFADNFGSEAVNFLSNKSLPGRRPFIISTLPQKELIKKEKKWAICGVVIFIVSGLTSFILLF